MYRFRQISKILIFTVLLFVVNSCAVLKLPPPDHDIKTILVLPFKVIDKTVETRTRGHGFNYGYEIVGIDDENFKYEATFALSNNKEEILIVDSIPPGYYFVNKLNVFPNKPGARVNNKKGVSRYDTFELVSGKITIFPLSLNILVEESSRGRRYSNKMSLVEWRQKDQIIKKLKELENFDKWEVLGMESNFSLLDEKVQELEDLRNDSKTNVNSDKSAQPITGADVSDTNTLGTYVTDVRGGWIGIVGGNRKFKITLKQSGNDIIGTDVNQKKIVTGTRKEDTIKFKYFGRGSHLTGEWKINSDGTTLEGTWDSSRENGKWNLTRIE